MNRKYVFAHPISAKHYTAEVFALRCFDNRFWKTFKCFMKNLGLGDIDPVSPAGGAKVLASPEKKGDRDYMLREIGKSVRLHHPPKVMLFTHSDCGAYGGLKQFNGDEDEEFKFHSNELRKARKVVKIHFPDLKIETYFIDKRGVIRIS